MPASDPGKCNLCGCDNPMLCMKSQPPQGTQHRGYERRWLRLCHLSRPRQRSDNPPHLRPRGQVSRHKRLQVPSPCIPTLSKRNLTVLCMLASSSGSRMLPKPPQCKNRCCRRSHRSNTSACLGMLPPSGLGTFWARRPSPYSCMGSHSTTPVSKMKHCLTCKTARNPCPMCRSLPRLPRDSRTVWSQQSLPHGRPHSECRRMGKTGCQVRASLSHLCLFATRCPTARALRCCRCHPSSLRPATGQEPPMTGK
mmetsp:Transcript_79356/g.176126  ORF Transcript_79356/g.176126 Transcript_79356/m.176126 type:complete len:253 (-) Transcript_79356:18-776(-)